MEQDPSQKNRQDSFKKEKICKIRVNGKRVPIKKLSDEQIVEIIEKREGPWLRTAQICLTIAFITFLILSSPSWHDTHLSWIFVVWIPGGTFLFIAVLRTSKLQKEQNKRADQNKKA